MEPLEDRIIRGLAKGACPLSDLAKRLGPNSDAKIILKSLHSMGGRQLITSYRGGSAVMWGLDKRGRDRAESLGAAINIDTPAASVSEKPKAAVRIDPPVIPEAHRKAVEALCENRAQKRHPNVERAMDYLKSETEAREAPEPTVETVEPEPDTVVGAPTACDPPTQPKKTNKTLQIRPFVPAKARITANRIGDQIFLQSDDLSQPDSSPDKLQEICIDATDVAALCNALMELAW
jgi:hypothetical protein